MRSEKCTSKFPYCLNFLSTAKQGCDLQCHTSWSLGTSSKPPKAPQLPLITTVMVLAFQLSQLFHDLGSNSLLRSSRHLIECRFILQDVYLAIPGSLGWILLPFDFCPGLAQHELTGRVGLPECLRFGTYLSTQMEGSNTR